MRLQKYLAHAGIASRRKSEKLISQGRVKVNGQVIDQPGYKIDPEIDEVLLDNQVVSGREELVYYLLNKPQNCITSTKDPQGRKTVLDYLQVNERVYPVGRLDYDSRGLLLLTNDGELANRLMHPRYQIPKTYIVEVDKSLNTSQFEQLIKGIDLEEGICKFSDINYYSKSNHNILKVILTEGRKRQIKRMLSVFNIQVLDLQRVKFGPIKLGNLKEGQFRHLDKHEIYKLRFLTGLTKN